jgi:rfaE bifunctional protein kinase chain/domain
MPVNGPANARARSGATGPSLVALLRAVRGVKIAVLGDVILDHFLWGDATRISPEAPVPVILLERESYRLGGAANVAANVVALGGKAALVGLVGADGDGAIVKRLLRDAGVDAEGLVAVTGRPTTVKQRVLAQNKHVLRIDRERVEPLAAATARRLRAAAELALADCAGLIISDYAKGCLAPAVVRAALRAARRRRLPVCVDPKTQGLPLRGATLLKPNLRELAVLTGAAVHDDAGVAAAAAKLRRRYACPHVLVTRGGAGMSWFGPEGLRAIPSAALEVADVTGAGDTVAAALGLALAARARIEHAAGLANLAAGLVVAKSGTATVTAAELTGRLDGRGGGRSKP